MKKVFSGEVYEMMPLSNGIIFSYCKDTIDERVVVAYKMISFENGRFTDVAKNIYLLTKFGNNYKAVSALCDNYIMTKSIILPNNKVFLLEPDGSACLADVDATPVWTGDLRYRNQAPSDIAMHKNTLWACYSESNVILKFNLTTMREELRIGGVRSPFSKPNDMFVDGDNAMISNVGSNKLIQVNLNSYSVFDYETFDEPVYQYIRAADCRFVVLKSGLYLI